MTQTMNHMDWDVNALPEAPSAPDTLQQTGLNLGMLSDMILRTLYTRGGMLGLDLARLLCLPFKVIEEALGFLKHEKCIEVLGGDLIGRISYKFTLTELGRRRANEAFKMCAYVGPAPVPLEDYIEQTYRQAVTAIDVSPDALRRLQPPGGQRGAVQRRRPRRRQRQVGVHLWPAGQRQDVDRPGHRQLHEQLRRRDLHPLRLHGRGQHRHRLRLGRSRAERGRR